MALPTYTTTALVDGGTANIADFNTPFNEIRTLLLGALDALNLKDGGVNTPNIADLAVQNARLANLSVSTRALGDSAVENSKLNNFVATQLINTGASFVFLHARNTLTPIVGIGFQAAAGVTDGCPYFWTVVDANNIEVFNLDSVNLTFEVTVI